MRKATERNVRGRTRETFRARQLDRSHAQTLDVARMPNRSHGDAIVDLENLLARAAQGDKNNSLRATDRRDRTARCELRLNVLAPIRDRLNPTIRLFDHATELWNTSAIDSSARVLMPSREPFLIPGKMRALRSPPPVAVSDSAAVSSARSATVIASFSSRSCRALPVQRSA